METSRRTRSASRRCGAGLASLALLCGLTACAVPVQGTTGQARCDVQVHHPHESHGSPGYMDAKMTLVCDAEVSDVWGEIELERQQADGSWATVPVSLGTRKMSVLAPGKKFTVMTDRTLRCLSGTYRAVGRGGASYQGVPNSSGEWVAGSAVRVRCRN